MVWYILLILNFIITLYLCIYKEIQDIEIKTLREKLEKKQIIEIPAKDIHIISDYFEIDPYGNIFKQNSE